MSTELPSETLDSVGRLAYGIRRINPKMSWHDIGHTLGYSHSTTIKAARYFAAQSKLPWQFGDVRATPESFVGKGERAYAFRAQGLAWAEVARLVESPSSTSAKLCARNYALIHGLVWPIVPV